MTSVLTRTMGDEKERTAMGARAHLSGATTYKDRWRASLNRAVAAGTAE
jgi:hypothetical protein